MIKISTPHIRITGTDKDYVLGQFEKFAKRITSLEYKHKEVTHVAFGKQDTRGGPSITFIDDRGYTPKQICFHTKDELIGYVIGFNAAIDTLTK